MLSSLLKNLNQIIFASILDLKYGSPSLPYYPVISFANSKADFVVSIMISLAIFTGLVLTLSLRPYGSTLISKIRSPIVMGSPFLFVPLAVSNKV